MEQHQLEFKASNGYPSSCQVTIYRDIQVVVVSETGEGMSITNAAEIIATQVVKQFGLDPKRMLLSSIIQKHSDPCLTENPTI